MRVHDLATLPFASADGSVAPVRGVTFVLEVNDGLKGFGTTRLTTAEAEAALELLRPLVVGVEFDSPEQARTLVEGALPINSSALAALDDALWDVWAQRLGVSVSVALGGRHRERVRTMTTVLPGQHDLAAELAQQGSVAFVVDGVPTADELTRLRGAVGDDAILAIAAHSKLSRHEATRLVDAVHASGAWLLDPLSVHDVDGYAALRRISTVPILAGATADAVAIHRLLEAPSVDGVIVDIDRVGGLTAARAVLWSAEDSTASVILCGSDEPNALATDLHLAAATAIDCLVALGPGASALIGSDGCLAVPADVGLGSRLGGP